MSLNYKLTGIKDWETVCAHPDNPDHLNPITDALIWGTIYVDLGSITEANVPKWIDRLRQLAVIDDYLLVGAGGAKRNPTEAELRSHIGLTTNVSPKTDAQFARKIGRLVREKAEGAARLEAAS